MPKDDWIREALTDDTVVVELLFRLRQSSSEPPSNKLSLSSSLPPQRWGIRHPRSKSVTLMRKEYSTSTTSNTSAMRCSPTTPLSWSGGSASPSADSTRLPSDPSSSIRSKGSFDYEISQMCSTNPRSQRKKKFEDLKEKESLLPLKERVQLQRDLPSVNIKFGEQKDHRLNLKRMKFDLNFGSMKESGLRNQGPKESNLFNQHKQIEPTNRSDKKDAQRKGFVLPDLNMTPLEEDNISGYG